MIGRPKGDTCPPEVVARLGGEPDTVIARDVGVTPLTVRNWRRARGIPAAPRQPAAPKLERRARAGRPLRTEGEPRCRQIGVRLTEAELRGLDERREEGETRTAAIVRLAGLA